MSGAAGGGSGAGAGADAGGARGRDADGATGGAGAGAPPAPARRRGGVQHVFVVERTGRVSSDLVRVHLGGPAFDAFVAAADPACLASTDAYVKLLLPPAGSTLDPPYDLDALRATVPAEQLPVRRTYTVRAVDHDARTIAIDFVVHGTVGVAGPWAASARPGDRIALSGPGGLWSPTPGPDTRHVLLGDEAAAPAIAAALERMGPEARGTALIEVASAADEFAITVPPGVSLRWVHRGTGADVVPGQALVAALTALPVPADGERVSVFAHGERTAMKAARVVLQEHWGLDRSALSLSAYWALGRAEDRFQAEKREPVGDVFAA